MASTYSAHMLPLLLRCFGTTSAAFMQASQQLAQLLVAQQGAGTSLEQQQQPQQQQEQLAAVGVAVRAACRDLEVALRLLARCGPSLPLRGLGEQASHIDVHTQAAVALVCLVVLMAS